MLVRQDIRGGGGKMLKKRGQSILEYVIVLIAIVAAVTAGVVYFASSSHPERGLGKLMNDSAEVLKRSTAKIGGIVNGTD